MELFAIPIIVLTTAALLKRFAGDKSSSQIMLLGIEITIVGALFMGFRGIINSNNSVPNYLLFSALIKPIDKGIFFLLGLLLVTTGFIVSIFGFRKSKIQ